MRACPMFNVESDCYQDKRVLRYVTFSRSRHFVGLLPAALKVPPMEVLG